MYKSPLRRTSASESAFPFKFSPLSQRKQKTHYRPARLRLATQEKLRPGSTHFPSNFFFFFFFCCDTLVSWLSPHPPTPCCHFRASRSQGEAATYEKLISPLPPHPPRGLGGDPQPRTRFGLFAFAAASISKHVIFLWILMRLIRLLSGTTPIH